MRLRSGMVRISSDELLYMEVRGHSLTYHLSGQAVQARGTMERAEEQLDPWSFLRCNNCYLVNPRYIDWVRGYTVKIGEGTSMLRIAIAEDEPACAQRLQEYIRRYAADHKLEASVTWFSDGIELAEKYTPAWDIIFLDIQMTHLDGMETARRIRRQDSNVILVFITNLARYAIQGYEVDASDFILKPLEYDRFRVRMDKFITRLTRRQESFVVLPLMEQKIRVAVEDILYAEVVDHELQVVTVGQRYLMRCTLQEMEQMLEGQGFSRCSRSYLVNLRRVSGVEKDAVRVGEHTLPISRPRKKQFLRELSDCLGAEL